MDLIDQLIKFYYEAEWWHETRLSEPEIKEYYRVLIGKGRLVTVMDENNLLGYCESWRINYDKFGKLLCHVPINIAEEDISTGNIAYVFSVYVDKPYRNTKVITSLKHRFFALNYDCDYFVGEALRKKHQPVKVFKRQDFYDRYIKESIKERQAA